MKTFFAYKHLYLLLVLVLTSMYTQAQCPEIIRGPYLQPGSDGQATNSITVRWRTETGENMKFCYRDLGSSSSFTCTTVSSQVQSIYQPLGNKNYSICDVFNYEYTLSTTNAKEYVIRCTTGEDKEHGTILPYPPIGQQPSGPLDIWIMGDGGENGTQTDHGYEEVISSFENYTNTSDIDLIMLLGDNAYNLSHTPQNSTACSEIETCIGDYCEVDGNDYSYQDALFTPFQEILKNLLVWPAIGNHEIDYHLSGNDDNPLFSNIYDFFNIFSFIEENKGYYSYDYGDIHFICLNSEIDDEIFINEIEEMKSWLQIDLQNSLANWNIVYFHHPIHSAGERSRRHTLLSDVEGDMETMILEIAPVLDEYDVDLVLSGHNHHYERSFLVDGHYDNINQSYTVDDYSFSEFDDQNPTMLLDDGCGGCLNDYYTNPNTFNYTNFESDFTKIDKGTVYAVLGSSGKASDPSDNHDFFNHPMMRPFSPPSSYVEDITVDNGGRGIYERGSMKLSIEGNTLTATVIAPDEDDANSYKILDRFTITKGCAADATFTYNQSNDPTIHFIPYYQDGSTYEWDFGDGNTSNEMSPIHTYTMNGQQIVTLTIYEDGCEEDYSFAKAVNIHDAIMSPPCPVNKVYGVSSNVPETTYTQEYIKFIGTDIHSDQTVIAQAGDSIVLVPFVQSFPINGRTKGGTFTTSNPMIIEAGASFETFIAPCPGTDSGKTEEKAMDNNLSLFDEEATSLKVYPNPFSDQFSIEYNVGIETPVNIEIYSIAGRLEQVVMENEWHYPGSHAIDLDGSHLSKGVYMVNIKTNDGQLTQKLIKL